MKLEYMPNSKMAIVSKKRSITAERSDLGKGVVGVGLAKLKIQIDGSISREKNFWIMDSDVPQLIAVLQELYALELKHLADFEASQKPTSIPQVTTPQELVKSVSK